MYRKKQKEKRNKIIIICVLIFCLITGFIINVVMTDRNLTIFEKQINGNLI